MNYIHSKDMTHKTLRMGTNFIKESGEDFASLIYILTGDTHAL